MTTYSGQVLDELNRPVPGASIYVLLLDGSFANIGVSQPIPTDDFGNYSYTTSDPVYRRETWFGGKKRFVEQLIESPLDASLRTDLAASGGAALMGFVPSGTGAVSRTVQDKLREIFISAADYSSLQNAIDFAASTGAALYLPTKYTITAGLTASVPSGKTLRIIGNGPASSGIALANSGGAKTVLSVTLADWTSTFQFRDVVFTTSTANQDTGVSVTCTTPASSPALTAQSLFENVTFQGSDGPVVTKYFAINVLLTDVSTVSFARASFLGYDAGAGAFASNGIGVKLLGQASPVKFGVVMSFVSCQFVNVGTGLYYGTYIQGVTIGTSNFTGCTTGISIPDNTGTGQLSITVSQFDCGSYGIHDAGEWGIEVNGCYFNIQQPSTGLNNYGIYSANPNGVTITGNYFARQSTGAGTSYGVYITGPGTIASSITGNTFDSLDYGQYWAADTVKLTSSGNAYSSCTHLCWNLGASGMNNNGDAIARSSTAISLGGTLAAAATTTVDVSLPSGMFAQKPEKIHVTIGDGTVPLLVWANLTSSSTSIVKVEVYNPTGSTAAVGPYRFNVTAAQS